MVMKFPLVVASQSKLWPGILPNPAGEVEVPDIRPWRC
jgi:hypothetical protein